MTTLLEQIEQKRLDLAQRRHSPTRAMQNVAKRGIRQAADHQTAGREIDPVALSVGRRIASGQQLSDDHVEEMAAYHAAHDGPCPASDDQVATEDMLWGGTPGANWSSARCAAVDIASLSESSAPSLLALAQEGKGINLEVFVRDHMGEASEVDAENKLIWSPILRSGMLATRPGPNGEKLHEPLVFVSGHAADPHRQIGLQNLKDAFDANAVQHVTIPTSHDNKVTDNTGFIVDLKIVDSKRRPGEKVLMAAHDFRDPEVKRKVELGTIANRSCGIIYDHVNTESGQSFPQALEHVALTNKPWVTGMAPYGASEDDFSDREIVPMLLSEAPRPTQLADASTDAWDGSESRFDDKQWARSCVLDRGTGTAKARYSEPIREPDGTLNANAVHSAAGRLSQVKGASLAEKKAAARKLVAAYRQLSEQPPAALTRVVAATTNMSEPSRREALLSADVQWGDAPSSNDLFAEVASQLQNFRSEDEYYPRYDVMDVTTLGEQPKALVRCDYGDPDGVNDAWVIPIEVDGNTVQLSDYSQWTPVEKKWVTDDDAARDKSELGSILGSGGLPVPAPPSPSYDALSEREQSVLRLSERSNDHQQGGAMPPTTQELLERLGLSDDQRTALAPLLSENQTLRTQLAEVTKTTRQNTITARVQALQAAKFSPGFCRRYEEIALGDDGQVAAVLNLSDGNGTKSGEKNFTATEIADSLIACLSYDESSKLALADKADLLRSPIGDRPPVNAADQAKVEEKNGAPKPKTAEEWLAEAETVAPGVTSPLNLSTTQKGA